MIKSTSKLVSLGSKLHFTFAQQTDIAQKQQPSPASKEIKFYKNGELISRSQIVVKKHEDIEGYVIKLIKNYFRTTNKAGVTLESKLEEHGLDSLDSIELAMQIEEDLDYVVSAETLPVLNKVKHFVNYIKHVEQFKEEYKKAPLP